ncbi:hypothetical protein V8017_00295 [Stenotrophomonas rhizophila]
MSRNVHLLGRGLDAVLLPGTAPITAEQRLERYYRAVLAHPGAMRGLRIQLGECFQSAWKRGAKPRLSHLHVDHPLIFSVLREP